MEQALEKTYDEAANISQTIEKNNPVPVMLTLSFN